MVLLACLNFNLFSIFGKTLLQMFLTYISWIIECANCIFSWYCFPSSHSENDDEYNGNLTAIVECLALQHSPFFLILLLLLFLQQLCFFFLSSFMLIFLCFFFLCYSLQFFDHTLRTHVLQIPKLPKTHNFLQ